MPKVLITGAAGFIGNALSLKFLSAGYRVVGLDNLNAYYDTALKLARLARVEGADWRFHTLDLTDAAGLDALFREHRFDIVVNMAAQAGVRYSITNPQAYARSNLDGFLNVLEACRHHSTGHLIYASSSSVYGAGGPMPFSTRQPVDHPVSFYAATKKANELMAHSYSELYALPTTGLRLFTVYGPWGRPDMAMMLFARAILAGEPIQVFNHGRMLRDFTFIDDIVEWVFRLSALPPQAGAVATAAPDPASSRAPYRIYNLGNNEPVELGHLIATLETALGRRARREDLPMQPGDVPATFADIDDTVRATGYRPQTSIESGVGRFVAWYRSYYAV